MGGQMTESDVTSRQMNDKALGVLMTLRILGAGGVRRTRRSAEESRRGPVRHGCGVGGGDRRCR